MSVQSTLEKLKQFGEKVSSSTVGKSLPKFLTFFLALCLGLLVFYATDYFKLDRLVEDLEWKTFDLRAYLQRGDIANKPSDDIVIIKFDDPTLNNFEDEYGIWPWPRQVHADMMHWFNAQDVRAMAYDIMFISKRKGEEASDKALIDAYQQYDNVYLSMNLDNNETVLKKLGKALTPKDYQQIIPMSLPLDNQKSFAELNDGIMISPKMAGYYPNLTFGNYRKILPGLMTISQRLGVVNHFRGKDGISRGNPLLFRLAWDKPLISPDKPYNTYLPELKWEDFDGVPHRGLYKDSQGQLVNSKGCYLLPDSNRNNGDSRRFKCKTAQQHFYYPYLGLRLALDLKFTPEERQHLKLTESGNLVIGQGDKTQFVPLEESGMLLAKWYNLSLDEQQDKQNYQQLADYKKQLLEQKQPDSDQLAQVQDVLKQLEARMAQGYGPKPYAEVSVWQILKAMKNEAKNHLTEEDKQLKAFLKDKILFIGTTAVSTYDIKTTSISRVVPGVILQATIFDNLYQDNGYMHRADRFTNALITGLLCLLSAFAIIKLRSAVGGLAIVLALSVMYISGVIYAYHHWDLWLNMAAPTICMTVITIVTFMVKYVSRDQDYEKTYAMATTDVMTGLKNHRYFQDKMRQSIEFSNKFETPFSLVLIDIDHFKKFNDTYGHQAGDEVLRAVAKKLQQTVRSNDMVARYGGEEMAIILDKASEKEGLMVADKVVKAIASEAYPIAEGVFKHVTISAGVATYPMHGDTPAEMIEFSDKGLYRAKEAGRNQVGEQFDGGEASGGQQNADENDTDENDTDENPTQKTA